MFRPQQPQPASVGGVGARVDPRTTGFTPNPKARLRDQVHEAMRFFHYARRTEETYWGWIERFLRFCRDHPELTPPGSTCPEGAPGAKRWRHPRDMGAPEAAAFLSHLAQERNVSAATQNQALNALVFLYGVVLHQPLGDLGEWARAQRPVRLPAVLTKDEVMRLLVAVDTEYQLPVRLIYGSGLRLMELARLRVKDLDLARRQLTVRDGKGAKDRLTMVPEVLVMPLQEQLARARRVYEADRQAGAGDGEAKAESRK